LDFGLSPKVNPTTRLDQLTEIYRVDNLPVFQNRMFLSAEEARNCVKGDVVLVQDRATGLIFNRAFNPELMQYDASYQNEQAVSGVFRDHLKNISAVIERHFSGLSLIEVGCGKGHFLEQLQSAGFTITGLDPTYEGSNPAVIKEYFGPETGLHADGVILRHVLEHVQNPVAFIEKVRDANGGKGKVYIEVPCLDWICEHRAWFDIFYEHVNYFRLSDFRRMFGTVYDSGHVFAGQYLYVVADLSSIRLPFYDEADAFEFPKNFLGAVDRHAERLQNKGSTNFAIWGGASKGVTFALFMRRAGVNIQYVIDINPAKHGKYLPSTGLLVQSPKQAIERLSRDADIFVMNANYLQEIIVSTNHQFNYITVDNERI
jgi:hypothetical protein